MSHSPPAHVLHWRSRIYGIAGLAILLIVVAVFATAVGSVNIPFSTTGTILLSRLPLVGIAPEWAR